MAALIVSIIALVASIAIPLLLDHRQGPRVRVRVARSIVIPDDANAPFGQSFAIRVVNNGRMPITVASWLLINSRDVRSVVTPGPVNGVYEGAGGHPLPYELAPYSMGHWYVRQDTARGVFGLTQGVPRHLKAAVQLETGWRVYSRNKVHAAADRTAKPTNLMSRRARLRRWVLARERFPR